MDNDYNNKITELEETIKVLEAQRKIISNGLIPKNADPYAIKFLETADKNDINFLTTKELFDKFVQYRRQFTTQSENLLSMKMFNSVVRGVYPTASMKHTNRKNENVYYWVIGEENEL